MGQVKLGDVSINVVTSEDFTLKNKITDHPVEDNSSISDNVVSVPDVIKFQGLILHEGARDRIDRIKQHARKADVLTYSGVDLYENVVIESLITQRTNAVANGYIIKMQLKVIRMASSRIVVIDTRKVAVSTGSVLPGALEPVIPALPSIGLTLAGALTGSQVLINAGTIVGKVGPSVKTVLDEARDAAAEKVKSFLDFARNTFSGGGDN